MGTCLAEPATVAGMPREACPPLPETARNGPPRMWGFAEKFWTQHMVWG